MLDRSPPGVKQIVRRLPLVLLVVVGLLVASGVVLAQGGLLAYGSNTLGSLTAASPLAFFTFSGNTDDLVTIQAIGISPGMLPGISLNSPTQQQLANSSTDPFGIGDGQEARLTFRLPQDGIYTILVSNVNGAPGDFLLRLAGAPGAGAVDVSTGGPASADVAPGSVQIVNIPADPAAALTVDVSTQTPGYGYRVSVREPSGQVIAVLMGDALQSATANLPPAQGSYTLEIQALASGVPGTVTVLVLPVGAPTTPPPIAEQSPIATVEVTSTADSQAASIGTESTDCVVSTNGNVNLRSGPGTNFTILGSLTAGTSLPVIGTNSGWYAVDFDGVLAWAFGSVVSLSGSCNDLPVVEAGSPLPSTTPTATGSATSTATSTVTATPTSTPTLVQNANPQGPTATATSSPTATSTTQNQPPTATLTATTQVQPPTLTFTPTSSPTTQTQPTATFTPSYTPTTPPAAQVAPPDANFNNPLNLQLDSTGSVTDFVSYPGGDTQDRVRWDITGMNPNAALSGGRARLTLAVSCFGTGLENVTFFTGGQTFTCGQTIVDREVTYDSRTGQVTITAIGGQGTYVQWVLTGTAVRVN